jgi:hypothetical protein
MSVEHPHLANGAGESDEAHAGPWREPARGGHPDTRLAARPGADQLQATLDGSTPAPPLSRLTGMRLVEFAPAQPRSRCRSVRGWRTRGASSPSVC